MKKRNCRKTATEREQHDRAIRIRKMTDAQLCEYLDELENGTKVIENFLDDLRIRKDNGLRVSDSTIRKLKVIAQQRGYLSEPEDMSNAV